MIFIDTGTGIDILLFLSLLLNQSRQSLASKLNVKQQTEAQKGSLLHLRLLSHVNGVVGSVGSLAIPGIVSGVCIIFDE